MENKTLLTTPFSNVNLPETSFNNCLNWFNDVNNTHFNPTTVGLLFGTHNQKSTVDKLFNYTLLFMRRDIYTRKLNEDALLLLDFINKIIDIGIDTV